MDAANDIEVLKEVQGVNDVFINNSVVAYNDILVPAATGDWELIGYTVDWAENI
jgi:hypothetical protein